MGPWLKSGAVKAQRRWSRGWTRRPRLSSGCSAGKNTGQDAGQAVGRHPGLEPGPACLPRRRRIPGQAGDDGSPIIFALRRIARLQPAPQRFHPLGRGAVGEIVGTTGPGRLVSMSSPIASAARMPSSTSPGSITVRPCESLAWRPRRRRSNRPGARPRPGSHCLRLRHPRLRRLALVERAFEVLDVVADFMRDDIGRGEIARRLEAARQFVEEIGVDVDALVGRGSRTAPSSPGRCRRRYWCRPCRRRAWSAGIARPIAVNKSPHTRSVEPSTPGRNWRISGVELRLARGRVWLVGDPPPPRTRRCRRRAGSARNSRAGGWRPRPGRSGWRPAAAGSRADCRRRRRRCRRHSCAVFEIVAAGAIDAHGRIPPVSGDECFTARNGCNRRALTRQGGHEREPDFWPARSPSSPARPRASASPSRARSAARGRG